LRQALDAGILFEDVIRDGGNRKRYGYVKSPPVVDIPADIYEMMPEDGVTESRLIPLAFERHGYYKDEVAAAIATLLASKRIEERSGSGQAWRGLKLFKTGKD
jgi:hypothetical protein